MSYLAKQFFKGVESAYQFDFKVLPWNDIAEAFAFSSLVKADYEFLIDFGKFDSVLLSFEFNWFIHDFVNYVILIN